jgi:DNA modification methylase
MNIEITELQNSTETAIGYIPCYRLPFLSLYQIDVLEGLKNIPDKSQDLIIADPPYYKAINESWDKQWKTEAEYLDWCKLWFNECVRVLKNTGSFYCYGNFDILSKQKVLIFDKQLNFRQNITLDKGLKSIAGRTSDKLRMFPTASEYLLFYVKVDLGGNAFYSDNDLFKPIIEYLRNEFKEASKLGFKTKHFREWMGLNINAGGIRYFAENVWIFPKEEHYKAFKNTGRFQMEYSDLFNWYEQIKKEVFFTFNLPMATTDVWDFTPDKIRYGHPTQKPQDICQRIIKASSNENDNVLIPFAGSGSEVVGCKELKRNCIAFEIESKYIDIIKQRTNDTGKLF